MVTRPEVLALVPARGGSKSIPRKNLRLFAGHPLIAYSLAAGLQSPAVSRTLVSTDDKEIAEVGRLYGAEVPFLRPAALAQDDTQDFPVFAHALQWLAEHEDYRPDIVVQLRPTSPLRPPDLVAQAVELLASRPEADSVRGVVPASQNPYKMWRIAADGRLAPLLPDEGYHEPYNMPRQALPASYWQTGHIDAIRLATILEKQSLTGEVILPLLIDPLYMVDIDTVLDLERAQTRLSSGELHAVTPGRQPRPFPPTVELVILDFDGVLTDNRVWVNSQGVESVAASRSDGWAVARLKDLGVKLAILSTETDPVVEARARKLGMAVIQGVADKGEAIAALIASQGASKENTIYLGNDVNDVACFPHVACALVVADAHPRAAAEADRVLRSPGGQGAVRELHDLILQQQGA